MQLCVSLLNRIIDVHHFSGKRLVAIMDKNTTTEKVRAGTEKMVNILGAFFTEAQLKRIARNRAREDLGEKESNPITDKKDISLEEARHALKSMIPYLEQRSAHIAIKEVLDDLYDSEARLKIMNKTEAVHIRMNVLGPVLQKILAEITTKLGFEGKGLDEAEN
jgi:hypothetical protein